MDKRLDAILFGSAIGFALLAFVIFIYPYLGREFTQSYMPYLPIESLGAFLAGFRYRQLSKGGSLLSQAFPAAVTATLVSTISGFFSISNMPFIPDSSMLLVAVWISLSTSAVKGLFFGLFFGIAGYRFIDTDVETIKKGIFGMVLVFLFASLAVAALLSLFNPYATLEFNLLYVLSVFWKLVLLMLMTGITFAVLQKPFNELSTNERFVNLHILSFSLGLTVFCSIFFFSFVSLPFEYLFFLALPVFLGLLMFIAMNACKALRPVLAKKPKLSYGTALVAVFSIGYLLSLLPTVMINMSYGTQSGMFDIFAVVFILPEFVFDAAFVFAVFFFPWVLNSKKPVLQSIYDAIKAL